MNEKNLVLSVSPHIRSEESVKKVMWFTVLSLAFPAASAVYFFGLYPLLVMLVSAFTAVVAECILLKLRGRDVSQCLDGSAVVTGILLALTLPPRFPLWEAALGAAFAIVFAKQFFGGIGQNIFNPALVGRAFLMAAFPVDATTWSPTRFMSPDTFTGATPLANFKFEKVLTSYKDLFFGNVAGSMGETSALLIILGGLVLILKGYVDFRLPLSYIASVFCFGGIMWLINPSKYPDPLFHILAGGLMLGAFYMITDMVTSPITRKGRVIYGILGGFLVVLIRLFAGYPEGVMFSILIVNSIRPWIDRLTKPRVLGEV
ncbi:MAG TPA: RnfABCDGE type electron transport complex subunit D [Candidatus Hydrothermia bacterium]|nr:RnfABCDGE type electron transport complex subunit D [Candidatus Hydrothermia bacterium]HOP31841.1 RnfABCDGE type electron transport complex subunit D [Candidatus Hydrothermia bacterium]